MTFSRKPGLIWSSTRKLVNLVKELVDYKGEVEWDTTKPDRQPRRYLDTSRAREEFGWQFKTPLRQGLQRTIKWYIENYAQVSVGR